MASLPEKVAAAKSAVEAKYASQTASGVPLDPNQQAELLIAQVQAILGSETITLQAEEPL
jgi:hypothetical protein